MASTYLTYTPSSAVTLGTKATISFWVKRSGLDSGTNFYGILSSNGGWNDGTGFAIGWREDLLVWYNLANGVGYRTYTNRKFRDVNAWYHIVYKIDTTQASMQDRITLYVNGEDEGDLTSNAASISDAMPSQNASLYQFFDSGDQHQVGRGGSAGSTYFDGSLSHFHYVDGSALEPTAFGETDANGVWKINTSPSVTYGNNGFFILKDGNSVTDQSGNGNNFTVGGGTLTNTEDNPSNVFNVLNAVSNPPNGYTLSNGNLEATVSGSSFVRTFITNTIAPTSGKWYWESKLITSGGTDRSSIGICSYDENIGTGTTIPQNELSICTGTSRIRFTENGSTTEVDSFYTVPSANDIFMYALDLDNTKFYFGVNGNWWNYNSLETGGDPTSGSGYVTNSTNIIKGAMSAFLRVQAGAVSTTFTNQFNFGNGYFGTTAVASAGTNASGIGIFEYDVPTGYTALSTKGLNL